MRKPGLILIASFVFSAISGYLVAVSEACECGTTAYHESQDFIISGIIVNDVKKYPFVATIHENDHTWAGCGGAIISPTFILTAGHCVINPELAGDPSCQEEMTSDCYISPDSIKIGVYNKYSTDLPSKFVKIKKIIPHPNFDTVIYSNDLALIELQKPLRCTKYARPICINGKQVVGLGDHIQIAGYGRINTHNKESSQMLREGVMTLVEYSFCRKGKDPTVLCAVGENQSICQGDSGTIAFVKKNGVFTAVGITSSHTHKNCELGRPATLMSIKNHIDFIRDYVRDLPE